MKMNKKKVKIKIYKTKIIESFQLLLLNHLQDLFLLISYIIIYLLFTELNYSNATLCHVTLFGV